MSGEMVIGGYTEDGHCFRLYDFFCSENWRVETDDHGCEVWRSELRAPRKGENAECQPMPRESVDSGKD